MASGPQVQRFRRCGRRLIALLASAGLGAVQEHRSAVVRTHHRVTDSKSLRGWAHAREPDPLRQAMCAGATDGLDDVSHRPGGGVETELEFTELVIDSWAAAAFCLRSCWRRMRGDGGDLVPATR